MAGMNPKPFRLPKNKLIAGILVVCVTIASLFVTMTLLGCELPEETVQFACDGGCGLMSSSAKVHSVLYADNSKDLCGNSEHYTCAGVHSKCEACGYFLCEDAHLAVCSNPVDAQPEPIVENTDQTPSEDNAAPSPEPENTPSEPGAEQGNLHIHSGGTATCQASAVCTGCGESYGSNNASNHTGGTELRDQKAATCQAEGYTGDTYCKGCATKLESGKRVDKLSHSGGTATCQASAVCTGCGGSYGSKNAGNHTGGTELRDQKAATCQAEGYTGNTCCLGCGAMLKKGESTGKTGHTGGVANCQAPAICSGCGASYGNKDPNHHANTILADAGKATCIREGFTGATICVDCNVVLDWGSDIPVDPGNHVNLDSTTGKLPSCCIPGETARVCCLDCGTVLQDSVSIPPIGNCPLCPVCGQCEVAGDHSGC